MKTYECIAHSGNTGKQIVLFARAYVLDTKIHGGNYGS